MKSNRGQILPLALVSVLMLTLAWVTLLNAGKLLKDRIQIQIAADTAAQSACAIRARGLNSIGRMNSWLGTPVLGIGWPQAAWWPAPIHPMNQSLVADNLSQIRDDLNSVKRLLKNGPEQQAVAGLLQLLLKGGLAYFGGAYDIHPRSLPHIARAQKKFITAIRELQTAYNRAYGGAQARNLVRGIARRQGADDIYAPAGAYSLHLKPNHGPIWYLSTLHLWIAGKPFPFPFPFLPQGDASMEDDPATHRWYEQGPDFHRQSIRLYVYRRGSSGSQGLFPLGRQTLGVRAPDLYAVAAARAYNTKGAMFPTSGQTAGKFGGESALRLYSRASPTWRSQLVPVGNLYEH